MLNRRTLFAGALAGLATPLVGKCAAAQSVVVSYEVTNRTVYEITKGPVAKALGIEIIDIPVELGKATNYKIGFYDKRDPECVFGYTMPVDIPKDFNFAEAAWRCSWNQHSGRRDKFLHCFIDDKKVGLLGSNTELGFTFYD